MRIDYSPFVKQWIGLVKSLVQILLKGEESSAEIPELGIVTFNKKNMTLTIKLDEVDESFKEILNG